MQQSLRKWRWGCENALYLTSVLCGKAIQMDDVMTTVVKTINLICSRALKHREILVLLSDIDAEYGDVINHSNERGWVTPRLYSSSIRCGLQLNSKKKKKQELTLDQLNDPDWLADQSPECTK